MHKNKNQNISLSQHDSYVKFIERNQNTWGPFKKFINLFHWNMLKIFDFLEKEPERNETFIKIIIRYFFEVLKNSSMHGTFHLTQLRRHSCELLLWLFILIGAGLMSLTITNIFWIRYYINPMVITIERDYINWNITFPSLTLCNLQKINETALNEYTRISKIQDKLTLKLFIRQLANLTYDTMGDLMNFPYIHPNDYVHILNEVTYRNEIIVKTGNNEIYKMQRVLSEMGVCYTFNSKISNYMTFEYLINDELLRRSDEYLVTIFDNEKIAFVKDIYDCCEIYSHGPKEIPNSRKKIKLSSSESNLISLKYSSTPIISTESVRSLLVFQRKCRFIDESRLEHFPIHTMSLCNVECKIQAILSICKCIPFFYKRLPDENYCNTQGMKCIIGREDKINTLIAQCKCESDCEDIKFNLEQIISESRKSSNSIIQWEVSNTKVRLRRNVIFGYVDAIIGTGNACNLLLGISVISFVEAFWLYFIHLPIHCLKRNLNN